MNRTVFVRFGLGLATLALLAGCSTAGGAKGTQKIELTAQSGLKFGTERVVVKAGQPVVLTLKNQDTDLHDFNVKEIEVSDVQKGKGAADHQHEHDHDNLKLHLAVEGGKDSTLQFTPQKPGTYSFYCSVPGHKEGGMVGTLVVEAAV